MLTNTMKWVSMAALLSAMMWHPSGGYQTLLQVLVLAGAALVIVQSFRVDKVGRAIAFIAMGLLFIEITTPWPSRVIFFWTDAVCLSFFAVLPVVLKTPPRWSIISIIDRTLGDEAPYEHHFKTPVKSIGPWETYT